MLTHGVHRDRTLAVVDVRLILNQQHRHFTRLLRAAHDVTVHLEIVDLTGHDGAEHLVHQDHCTVVGE
jgi:hypothetical protein